MVKPRYLNFKVIKVNFSGVRIFRIFMIVVSCQKEFRKFQPWGSRTQEVWLYRVCWCHQPNLKSFGCTLGIGVLSAPDHVDGSLIITNTHLKIIKWAQVGFWCSLMSRSGGRDLCSHIWATSWENLFMPCKQQRRRSACWSVPLLFAACCSLPG